MPCQKKNLDSSVHKPAIVKPFFVASKFWCQNHGGTENHVLTPSPSCNIQKENRRPRAGWLNGAADRVTRARGTPLMTDYFVWEHTSLPLLVFSEVLDPPPPVQRAEVGTAGPLNYVSVWEWQSLKCCAMFVIHGLGCVTPPQLWPQPSAHSAVPTMLLVQDTKCTRKRKLNHILGINSISM